MSPTPTKRRFGVYDVLSPAGRGTVTDVFKARGAEGPTTGKVVALKRLRPELARQAECAKLFIKASELSRRLRHPHLLEVHQSGVLEGIHYAVAEWVDGVDLATLIKRCKQKKVPLPLDFALYIVRTYLEGLAHIHEAKTPTGQPLKVVHGAPSAVNVFVNRLGEVKLADAGMGYVRRAAVDAETVAAQSSYPSVALGKNGMKLSSDLWMVSATLYELITLERPFAGRTPDAVESAIDQGAFKPLRSHRPNVPLALDGLVERGLAFNPSDRFTSARELIGELESLYDSAVGTPMAIAAVIRNLFGAEAPAAAPVSRPAPSQEQEFLDEETEVLGNIPVPPPLPAIPKVPPLPPVRPPPLPTEPRTTRDRPPAKDGKEAKPARPAKRAPPPVDLPPGTPADELVGRMLGAEGKFQRGLRLLKDGKHKAAHAAFEDAVKLQAAEAELHAYLGWSLFQCHPHDPKTAERALSSLEQAKSLNPDFEKSYIFSGKIQRALGNKDVAQQEFETALKLNPGSREAESELRHLKKARK